MRVQDQSITLIATGDLAFNGCYHRLLQRYGGQYPFRQVKPEWKHADLRFGNLESPITKQPRVAPAKLTLRGAPQAIESLRYAQLDCVTLANNHMMDFGPGGLADTCSQLDHAGIAHVGAGRNLTEATAPIILERNGQKVGVLACCDVEQISPLYATKTSPGVAPFDEDRWFQAIRDLRGHVDWLVVQIHWGVEMSQLPTTTQRTLAHKMAAAGVDLVLGHHPHVLQPLDVVHGMPVAYSLGDFLFSNTYWYGDNSRGRFLACFRVHPLSRQTGWLESKLGGDQQRSAVLHPAVLSPGLSVRIDKSLKRPQELAHLVGRLHEANYELSFAEERINASQRDSWRLDASKPIRRVALKLLQWGCLPRSYVEPDGLNWRSIFRSLS